jgi:hypothetical protein
MGTDNYLLDSWNVTGTNYEEFIEEYTLLRHRTGYTRMRSSDDVIYKPLFRNKENVIQGYIVSHDTLEDLKCGDYSILSRETFTSTVPIVRTLISESMIGNRLLIAVPRFDNKPLTMFLSENCIDGLLQIAKIEGWQAHNCKEVSRNIFLSESLLKQAPYTYVHRKQAGYTKIFGIFTARREPRMLADIPSILEESGIKKYFRLRSYKIANLKTSILLDMPLFPNIDGLIPGIIISDSDTGTIPFTVQNVFYTDNQDYVIIRERKLDSKKKLTKDDYVSLLIKCADPYIYDFALDMLKALPERLIISKEMLINGISDLTARRFSTFAKYGVLDGEKKDVVLSLFNMANIFKRENLCIDDGSLTRIRREIPELLFDFVKGVAHPYGINKDHNSYEIQKKVI